jgi:hypothetical protein
MQLLYDIAGAASAEARREVDDIIGRFAHPNNSFVMLSSRELTPATVVDITHESLIRKWKNLEAWVREETRSAEWYADLSRDVVRYRSGEVGLWQDPELRGLQRRRAEEGWNEAWANQYRRDQDPEFAETVRFLGESTATQERRLREAAEQRDRELKQAQALARARRNQYAVALSLLVVVGVAAVMLFFNYRALNARTEEARRATEQYSKALADSEASRSAVTALEAEREKLKQSGTAANPVDQQRLAELTREIESARQQAKGNEDELTKLRNSQKQTDADRSGLLSRIDALQKERDQLRQQLNNYSVQQTQPKGSSSAGDDRASTLQKQLDDEKRTSASQAEELTRLRNENATLRNAAAAKGAAVGTVPSLQELTKYYTDGVRTFELKDYTRASDLFTMTIGHHLLIRETTNQRLPEQVRLSGTRFVPYAPFSYLVAAMFEGKRDCESFREFLTQTGLESAPLDVRRRVEAARKACP